jgi:YggT family protein
MNLSFFISTISQIFVWTVVISVVISFFLPPYHPVREALDRIIEPFLIPIRRLVPMAGNFDFSPLILILAVQLITGILVKLLK